MKEEVIDSIISHPRIKALTHAHIHRADLAKEETHFFVKEIIKTALVEHETHLQSEFIKGQLNEKEYFLDNSQI